MRKRYTNLSKTTRKTSDITRHPAESKSVVILTGMLNYDDSGARKLSRAINHARLVRSGFELRGCSGTLPEPILETASHSLQVTHPAGTIRAPTQSLLGPADCIMQEQKSDESTSNNECMQP